MSWGLVELAGVGEAAAPSPLSATPPFTKSLTPITRRPLVVTRPSTATGRPQPQRSCSLPLEGDFQVFGRR
ncbi:hypothetical protein BCR35DRAFT_300980 [Leucosporidium creatinivorum]|uniref:Uncharacterized protein n=1 Tax=Leucosporidium creatinivorum TaxID=106004 RepID=A0A1Y2FYN3_9BASI|nr:hypothetical protein BCR35DRAFT_300980 [Leucosporidium creatinivorum]